MSETLPITERTRLRRKHERGDFRRQTINAILDAMPLCHIGYVIDGSPVVMPTFQWREGNHVYWHGSNAGRGMRAAIDQEVCLTVSIMDGLVLARSAMHHSANFRSAMIFGRPAKIADPGEKADKLKKLIDTLYPGRWDTLRPMKAIEEKAAMVLSLPIEEASVKIRDAGVMDDEEDYGLAIWSGVIPLKIQVMPPEPDPRNINGVQTPDHATSLKLG